MNNAQSKSNQFFKKIFFRKIYKLENEMEDFKKEYVYLLQSCVRIPLHEHSCCDVVQVKLFGGDIVCFLIYDF